LVLLGAGCATAPVVRVRRGMEQDTPVERSAPAKPEWVALTPTAPGHKSFVGEGQDESQDKAKDAAIADMLKRYAEYLGVDFSVLVQMHQQEIQQLREDITHTERRVVTDAEAVSRIVTRGTEVRAQYWEKYDRSDGYHYRYWVLGEVGDQFIEAEVARLRAERQQEFPPDIITSDLEVMAHLPSGTSYKAGDTVRFVISADADCFLYMLNAYGGGKLACQYTRKLTPGRRVTLECPAVYGGKKQEDVKFVVSDEPLDIDRALKQVHPAAVVMALRHQAQGFGAKYAEKTVSILIESR